MSAIMSDPYEYFNYAWATPHQHLFSSDQDPAQGGLFGGASGLLVHNHYKMQEEDQATRLLRMQNENPDFFS
jgi:hypothetical protein